MAESQLLEPPLGTGGGGGTRRRIQWARKGVWLLLVLDFPSRLLEIPPSVARLACGRWKGCSNSNVHYYYYKILYILLPSATPCCKTCVDCYWEGELHAVGKMGRWQKFANFVAYPSCNAPIPSHLRLPFVDGYLFKSSPVTLPHYSSPSYQRGVGAFTPPQASESSLIAFHNSKKCILYISCIDTVYN